MYNNEDNKHRKNTTCGIKPEMFYVAMCDLLCVCITLPFYPNTILCQFLAPLINNITYIICSRLKKIKIRKQVNNNNNHDA